MFRFDSAERANREPASAVSLQVFDVGSGSVAGFFERLHRAMAIFAAHDLIAFCEGFVEGAWSQRPRTFTSHSVITGGFLLVVTDVFGCLPTSCPHTLFLQFHSETLRECALERAWDAVGQVTISRHRHWNPTITAPIDLRRDRRLSRLTVLNCAAAQDVHRQ
jgi:hypothetical protein